ncbi:MAG TPA: hypothetical protein PLI16_02100 [Bacteroidales bacterium]|jgi:hypothetical protein|nr:hypothetical protein [Bacteroidales bacterium]HNZ43766.1 hypothetical protein [Bacteroidales bacterium]HOH83382.1 hypothetical protein [Bacteroidales bacterium]HPB26169.1 hypothetical protein [Bacteroidales bacterium]HPI31043.1 hypothetical protein [Bacteroidales bacterium]
MNGKKQRGLKRYYKNLTVRNDFDKMNWLDFRQPGVWFDNWHLHFDRKGYGNVSFKRRKPHLDKLFRHFDLLAEMTLNVKTDFQLFAVIHDFDSANDGIFLNTPNPNSSVFPFSIPGLSLSNNLQNIHLADYLVKLSDYTILYGNAEENYCVLFKENIGVGIISD